MLVDKIYDVLDSGSFPKQLRKEQNNDPIIKEASEILTKGEIIKEGRLKHVQKQLRVENRLLIKAWRPIILPKLRKYVVSTLHDKSHSEIDKQYDLFKQCFFWPTYVKVYPNLCRPLNVTMFLEKQP